MVSVAPPPVLQSIKASLADRLRRVDQFDEITSSHNANRNFNDNNRNVNRRCVDAANGPLFSFSATASAAVADQWSEALLTAFSPDESHFAWACGPKTVAVVPWKRAALFLADDGQRPAVCSPKPTSYDTYYDNDNSPLMIHCDDLIWSLAFGSTCPTKQPPSVSSDYFTSALPENVSPLNFDANAVPENVRRRASLTRWPDFYNFSARTNRLILAVGLKNGRVRLYSIYGAKFITELIDHKSAIRQMQFRPIGYFGAVSDSSSLSSPLTTSLCRQSLVLLTASRDSTLKLWNLHDDCNMFKTLTFHEPSEWVTCCSWSPNGRYAASGGTLSSLFVYDTVNWSRFRNLKGHLNSVTSCEFSPDSALLASASYDTSVILWDFVNDTKLSVFRHLLPPPRLIYASGSNGHYVRCLSFSPDGEHLATVCEDGFLRIWSALEYGTKTPQPVAAVEARNAVAVSYSPGGTFMSLSARDSQVQFFVSYMRVKTLAQICRLTLRRILTSQEDVEKLPLTNLLRAFLLYRDATASSSKRALAF